MRYETQLKVGLVALALAVVGMGLTIVGAFKDFYDYGAWEKAQLQVVSLCLLTVGALIVIAAIWAQYVKQQPVGPLAFIVLAMITITTLGMAWRFLAQAVVRSP